MVQMLPIAGQRSTVVPPTPHIEETIKDNVMAWVLAVVKLEIDGGQIYKLSVDEVAV